MSEPKETATLTMLREEQARYRSQLRRFIEALDTVLRAREEHFGCNGCIACAPQYREAWEALTKFRRRFHPPPEPAP